MDRSNHADRSAVLIEIDLPTFMNDTLGAVRANHSVLKGIGFFGIGQGLIHGLL
jgi:hypothetical protein